MGLADHVGLVDKARLAEDMWLVDQVGLMDQVRLAAEVGLVLDGRWMYSRAQSVTQFSIDQNGTLMIHAEE